MGQIFLNVQGPGIAYVDDSLPEPGQTVTLTCIPDPNCTLDDIIATDSWDNPIALSVVQQQSFVFRREWNNMYIEVRFSGQTPPGPTPLSPAVLLAIRSKPRPKCMY